MAVLAITNTLLIHAESPVDIEALGSNDGITADHIAWVEEAKSWAIPLSIGASATTWNMIPLENPPTVGFYSELQFYLDAGNNLCNPNASATFANDLRANNTGYTISNVTESSSHYAFNGTTSSIAYTKTADLDDIFAADNGGTFMAWVRVDNHAAVQKIASTESASTNTGWTLFITSTGTLSFIYRFATPGNWNQGTASADRNRVDQWQLVTVTYDGNVANDPTFYTDGLLRLTVEVSPPSGSLVSDAGEPLYLGDDEAGNFPLGGNIEMALAWTRVLDADEIQAIYDSTKHRFQPPRLFDTPDGVPLDGLVAFMDAGNSLSFPEGNASNLRDLMGNATGVPFDGPTVVDSHLNFDGINDSIAYTKGTPLDYLFDPTGPGATVMMWCRPETLVTSTLLSTRGAGDNDGWNLQLGAGGAIVFTHDFSTVNYSTGSNNNLTSVDRWASLTVKGVANSAGLFIDAKGGSQTGFGGTGTAADDTGNSLYLGENEDATDPFDGDIDVILIWNRVLSNAEVKQAHDALRPRFVAPGMVLIDTLTATSGVTSLTFSDLNGNSDGTYYITGRSFNPPDPAPGSGPLLIEMRPNGLTTNMGSVTGNHKSTISGLVSTTGWILGGWALPEGATDGWLKMDAWIYPEENKGGSTSTTSGRRGYRGVATTLVGALGTGNILLTDTGGYWNEATTNITSLDIVAAIGTMDTGTSFSLYYIEDAD